MENGDLKRYYKVEKQESKDFARLNAEGKIDKDLLPSDVGTTVVANPTGEATADLTKLQVDTTIYGIPEGTEVVANPTLAGTEDSLNGLQVGDTKYKVDSGISQTDADARYLKLTGGTVTGAIELSTTGSITQKGKAVIQANPYNSSVIVGSYDDNTREIFLCAPNGLWRSIGPNTTYRILDTSNGLPLSGGTMTGDLNFNDGTKGVMYNNALTYLRCNYSAGAYYPTFGHTGNSVIPTIMSGSSRDIIHQKGSVQCNMLDTGNTSANPTLAGTETALTSLKLNGTNYAIAGGTQVTFVDWS